MIGAIIKSFQLVPLSYTQMAASLAINSYALIWIIFGVLQINMLLAITSIVILILNLGLLKKAEKTGNNQNIKNWSGYTIKLCALSNMAVTWILDQYNMIQTDLKPVFLLWTITLVLSIITSIFTKITNKSCVA